MIKVSTFRGPAVRALLSAAALAALSACVTNTASGPREGIGFREARFAEITAMREYRSCRDEALALDAQARKAGSAARYLASARLLEKCEAEVGPEAANLAAEERMRAYGLGVQNYIRGGDIAAARTNIEAFKAAFPGHDLYYADGSSFLDTMEILVGLREKSAIGQFSTANVNETLKSELRRARYWKNN